MIKTIRKANQLVAAGLVDSLNIKKIEEVMQNFSLSITPQMLEIMNPGENDQSDAIRQQFVPNADELKINPSELHDPISDTPYSPIKGLVHRHSDRCLLMPIMACPVYCRFCFRREAVGGGNKALSKVELKNAYCYIESHPEIWEVILTGGEPLILKPKTLAEILISLEAIPSVEVIRIHTRVPVVDSKRITEKMLKALKISKAVYIILHTNHASEFTQDAKDACARIVDSGIPMLSHTVLLKGINDQAETLGELMRTLVKNRIKPYYLHHPDLAKGTSHFRSRIKEGQKIVKDLRSQYSGLCQPTYVLDVPGGYGKVPISEQQIVQISDNGNREIYQIEDCQGNIHFYES
jgi:lysine 2,3-aminomutase